jgi:hypothetical protein
MTYADLLLDPRWDDKRKIILRRDRYTCQECGIKDTVLQVHHHFYHPNTMPWDYDNEVLITLCEKCHEHEEFLKNFDYLGNRYLLTLGLTRNKISRLISAVSQRINSEDISVSFEFDRIIEAINPAPITTWNENIYAPGYHAKR